MNYINDMRDLILACDKLQASIRVHTIDTNDELSTLYPLLSLYQQIEHVNLRCLEQSIIEQEEYRTIHKVISDRTKRYREWIQELGGKIQ